MTSRIGSQTTRWVGDFETTTDENDCRVWLWGMCSVDDPDDTIAWGIDIDSFMRWVSAQTTHTYFHNLGFDGRFLLDWLMNNGHRWVDDRRLRKGEFTTLISGQGHFYTITVRWHNGNRTEFRDSLKKLPMSVSSVAKAFKLDEAKGSIDYHAFRPVGYEPTDDELEYLFNDVRIIARALKQEIDEGMTRLTVGSDSLAEFKNLFGKKLFDRMFPILPSSMDAEIRRSYRGGFTYVDPRYAKERIGEGQVYDVNSLYPSVMYDRILPYGEPEYFAGPPPAPAERGDYPLFIVTLTFTAKLKPEHIPCIQIKANPFFMGTVYQTEITDPVTMTCTSVDLDLWMDHYDLEILSWDGGWRFHGTSGMFCDYIDKWMDIKISSTGGMKQIAKLHLNSLYGKFATNPNVTQKVPVLDDDGVVQLVMGDEEVRDPVYTPVGTFITAYARDVTIRAAQHHYDRFVYADTDSLHLLTVGDEIPDPKCEVPDCTGHPVKLNVDPDMLGAWKHETVFESAVYWRAKCYSERLASGKHVTHIAGLPDQIASQVTLDDFHQDKVFHGKLFPKHVRGGTVLVETTYSIK